ncbi:transcription factor Adf-1-like [Astatotilapia calliptera]|uniref:transcription factor Adf-1-like n=1 Tax=Astatotilapia calliptera TaxID=8154 RepID=UPI000647F9DE|nr:transcription factor Adf-1-like [Astatotilapia calliptera]
MQALESFEEQLAEQIALHHNLYDPGHKYYKNPHVSIKSWQEIAAALQTEPDKCREKWKQLRDRYVRAKKKFNSKSSQPARPARTPPLLKSLSWLDGYVKHRNAVTRYTIESPEDFSSSPAGPAQVLEDMANPYPDKSQSSAAASPGPSPHNSSQGGEIQLMESTLPSPSRSEGSPTRRCITPTPQSRPNKRKEHDEDHATTSIKDLLTDCSKMAALRDMCAVQGDELDESHYFGIVVAKGLRTLPDKMRADAMAQVMALLSNFRQQAFELQTTNDNKKT